MADTTNFAWPRPTVGGSSGSWGTTLNDTLGEIDADLHVVRSTANAGLQRTGGTMTGHLRLKTESADISSLGSVSGAVAIDLASAQFIAATITGPTTLSITNTPSGFAPVILQLVNNGGHAITWPSGTTWPGAVAPSFSATGFDVLFLYSANGGANWHGAVVSRDNR